MATTLELATKIQLHPRAVLMAGTIEGRMKNNGSLPGLTPHYAAPGCPLVQFDGANALEEPSGAEIEFNFLETGFPLPSALAGYSPKQGNLVQVMFGRNGQAPTPAAYRVLREASTKVSPYVGSKRQVLVATLPILTPGSMGVTAGRHYLLGLFEADGTPIWIHPDALAQSVLKSDFPADQRERSLSAVAPVAAPAAGAWFEPMRAALASTGLKGQALQKAIINARAGQLVEQGAAANHAAGVALASADLPTEGSQAPAKGPGGAQEASKAAPAPTSSRRGSGTKLMGK